MLYLYKVGIIVSAFVAFMALIVATKGMNKLNKERLETLRNKNVA